VKLATLSPMLLLNDGETVLMSGYVRFLRLPPLLGACMLVPWCRGCICGRFQVCFLMLTSQSRLLIFDITRENKMAGFTIGRSTELNCFHSSQFVISNPFSYSFVFKDESTHQVWKEKIHDCIRQDRNASAFGMRV